MRLKTISSNQNEVTINTGFTIPLPFISLRALAHTRQIIFLMKCQNEEAALRRPLDLLLYYCMPYGAGCVTAFA
jgi:hypothetical protein